MIDSIKIKSKLELLENFIVEMNSDNLESIKTICIKQISELISDLSGTQKNSKLKPQTLEDLIDILEYFEIKFENYKQHICFIYNGHKITYYKKSRWFSGKGIKDDRGAENLIAQLKK